MSRYILLLLLIVVSGSVTGKTSTTPLVLISIDGFAYDYLKKYQPKNIIEFGKTGVSAKLLPIYPSKTFPNHLSIITGMYPLHHGIIHNNFYSRKLKRFYHLGAGKTEPYWLTAKPFWSFVEQSKLKSAVYFWPELEASGQGQLPHYYIPYNKLDSEQARFDKIIEWLNYPEAQRPQFIASYFSSVDAAGHKYGPNAEELAIAVKKIDQAFGRFIQRLHHEVPFEVNVILVSDHGMVTINNDRKVTFSTIFDKKGLALLNQKQVIIAQSSTQLYLYFSESLSEDNKRHFIHSLEKRQKKYSSLYQVYQQNTYPQHWHLAAQIDRIPDVIIEALPQSSFVNPNHTSHLKGTHGYDPVEQSALTAIFMASGINIKKGAQVQPFENIHIVPLMSQLLSLESPQNIDGSIKVLSPIIRKD